MKLYNQMALAISFIIITILASVMAVSYQSTKKDMLQSVYEASVNNIATLAHTLASAQGDEVIMMSSVDAAFDSGYYKSIEFRSSDGEFVYKQEDSEQIESVPAWFVKFADVANTPISEDVLVGWESIGKVSIVGDTAIVYKSLYKSFVRLLYLFAIFTVISLALFAVMLFYILKPLKEIQKQAEAIMRDEFVYQEKIPYTTEFKEVVKGMNQMVKKVEYIFIKGSEALKRNQELLYIDPITELYNRRYLLLKLPDLIALENRANGGTLVFLGLGGAEILNQSLGHANADKVFQRLGSVLQRVAESFDDGVAARVNGTEFIIVLPNCEAQKSLEVAKEIHTKYELILKKYELLSEEITLDIGLYRYRPNMDVSELLTKADNALTHAKADEYSSIYVYEERDDENAMGKEQWREIIEESIEKKQIGLKFWSVLDTRSRKISHNVMSFTIDNGAHKEYFYGDFIAPAINLGLVSKIYKLALDTLLTNKHSQLGDKLCSIRLSNEFIKDPYSYETLSFLLKEKAKELPFKLSFELSDNFVVKNPILVGNFIKLFKETGCEFGINAFTGDSEDFSYLKVYNPRFIKADVSFLLDQSQDSMGALRVITDSLGLEIIATSVRTSEELEQLRGMGIYSVQGPITDEITKSITE
ncbi:MAG: diguanylate cyclase [Campylobacterales bacterium]|nr:diguanylate cyclase [Campylobacterales bacterium]